MMYIHEWNNGNVITNAHVEYENAFDETYGEIKGYFPVITDNTIEVTKIKKSWTEREVKNLLYGLQEQMRHNDDYSTKFVRNFIKKNIYIENYG